MKMAALLGAVSAGSELLGAVKVVAIGLAVLATVATGYAGCQSLIDAGYSKAEADRLEQLAEQNAETAAKLKQDHAAASAAERRYRKERDRALAAEKQAREAAATARKAALRRDDGKDGGICPPGCTYGP